MTVAEQLKSDVTAAMKAGQRERVGALRLLISELQKDAKEGSGDELAVLRRERKRRLEAAQAYRDGGRQDLAAAEDTEAQLISGYLPAEMSDDELREIVQGAVRDSGAESVRDMGRAMGVAMSAVAGRADGRRVSALVKEALAG
ncbi:MAG TPA: GatB/YqeY domain-containing protein [Solirubrobacteraceae bacterium]|nr:GatB/YqeY domain-containing protein [Solirubrobacteraceae bacterium]